MADKPWDIPRAKTGDKNQATTFQAVGQALTNWEHLEAELGALFALLVGTYWEAFSSTNDPALRAYGAVIASAQRLTMIEAAAEAYFKMHPDKDLQDKLHEFIATDCRKFSTVRDNIAHGIVFSDFYYAEDSKTPKLGWFLVPSFYASKRNPIGDLPAYVYTTNEIKYAAGQFDLLYTKLSELLAKLAKAQT